MQRALILALSALLATATAACGKKEAPAPPPPDVKVATVLQKDVPIYVEAIGQTRGSTEIEVRARVEGFLETVDFKEGNPVRKGQLLYTIDPQPVRGRRSPRPRARSPRPRRSSPARARTWCATSRSSPRTRSRGRSTRRRSWSQRAAEAAVEAAQGAAAERRDRPRLHEGAGARERPRGQDRGLPGDPRGPRAEHAAHPHLADRDDPRALHDPRAGLPLSTRAGARSGGPGRGRRSCPSSWSSPTARCIPQKGQLVFVDRNVDAADRHDPAWRPRSRTRERSCGPGSTRACGPRWT